MGGAIASFCLDETSPSVGLGSVVLVGGVVAVLLSDIARFATCRPDLRTSSVVGTSLMPLEEAGEVFMVGMKAKGRWSLK